MQVKVESLSQTKKRISLDIPAARVAEEIDKVYDQIGKRAVIKGFRKGKAPRSILEKHYSAIMEEDVLKNLINETFFTALKNENILPVSRPVINGDKLKKGEPFKYTATVEVFPELVVKDYTGIEVKKEKYTLDEDAISKQVLAMQESVSQLKPVDENHTAEPGDFVTLDYKGFVDGAPLEFGEDSDFQIELGSGRFIPGFELQLVDMKAGYEGEIKVAFPDDYGKKELAGKEATFAVKIKEIKVKELPPLDDEFAKQFGDFDTFDQLRAKVVESHEEQQKAKINSDLEARLVTALIRKNELEVPETMIETQLFQMLDDAKKRLASQKLTLEMMGLDEKTYLEQSREGAEMQVKGYMLLDALAKQEGITVGEEDVEEKLQQLAKETNQELAGWKIYYDKNETAKENLIAQIKKDKVIGFLLSKANVSEVARNEL
ncbi:MAG: trigger factor [Geobacteraceae bacterium]